MSLASAGIAALPLLAALSAVPPPASALHEGEPILTERLLNLSLEAAILSDLIYDSPPDGSRYDYFSYYRDDDSPDRAAVVRKDGTCYGAFRGTEPTNLEDWFQNLDPRTSDVCVRDSPGLGCCRARYGFVRAYDASYREKFERDIRGCVAETCPGGGDGDGDGDGDGCLVLTGHSQGGAIAAIASVALSDLNPLTITFGQPRAVHPPCPYLPSSGLYRYVNAVDDGGELEHDVVPFGPGIGAEFFGYMIVLSPQERAAAGYPLDSRPDPGGFNLNVFPWRAHDIDSSRDGGSWGYVQRLRGIIAEARGGGGFPVSTAGWSDGDLCNDGGECASARCYRGVCTARVETCGRCDGDADCASERCVRGGCARPDGYADDGCPCLMSSECISGRCDYDVRGFVCQPKKYNGEMCNEDTDCESGHCSWWFRCSGSGGARPSLRYGIY